MTLDEQLQLISDSDLSISNKSGCKLMTYVLHLIQDAPVPQKRNELVERIREECPLTDFEREKSEGKDFERWEVYFSTFPINYSKAGFLIRAKDGWTITEEGVEFLKKNDPVEMLREAMRRYRKWEKENPKKKKDIQDATELPEYYRIWLMAPGEGASLWQLFQDKGEISIGWDDVGNLTSFTTLKSCTEKINALINDGVDHNKIGRCLWEFAHKMEPGDILVMKDGMTSYVGVGVVTSHYIWNSKAQRHKSTRTARWVKTGRWAVDGRINRKTLTDVTSGKKYAGYKEKLEALFELDFDEVRKAAFAQSGGQLEVELVAQKKAYYGLDELLEEVFMDRAEAAELLEVLNRKKNIILQGPPGTGKTFIARRLAYASMGEKDKGRVETVQFHQSYSYEDFIQGYRPVSGGQFDRKDGVFLRFCERARKMPEKAFFFVIDEINRGNLSKIFGELMMLIEADKRGDGHRVQLTYSNQGEHFSIPSNVHIIGTMNTADRSLAMVDYALRRRFAFFEMPPRFGGRFREQIKADGCPSEVIDLIVSRLTSLNEVIASDVNLGKGFQVGHSYFIDSQDGSLWNSEGENDVFASIIKHEVAPLLEEYWFDNADLAKEHIAKLNG